MYRSLVLLASGGLFCCGAQAQIIIGSSSPNGEASYAEWEISDIASGVTPTLTALDELGGPGSVENYFNVDAPGEFFNIGILAVSDWSTGDATTSGDPGTYFDSLTEALISGGGNPWNVDTEGLANGRMYPVGEAFVFTFDLSGLSAERQDSFTLLGHEMQGASRNGCHFDLLWYHFATNTIELLAEDIEPGDFVLNPENPIDIEDGDKLIYAVGASQLETKTWRWKNMMVDFGIRDYTPPLIIGFDTYGGATGSPENVLRITNLTDTPPTAGGDDKTFHLDEKLSEDPDLDETDALTITGTAVESWDSAAALAAGDINTYLAGLTAALLNGGGNAWGVDSTLDDALGDPAPFNWFDVLGEAMILSFDLSALSTSGDLVLKEIALSGIDGIDETEAFDYMVIDPVTNQVKASGTGLGATDAISEIALEDGYQLVIAFAGEGDWRVDSIKVDLGTAGSAATPVITSVEIIGTDLVVNFTGEDDVTYNLLESPDLVTAFAPTGVTGTTTGGVGSMTYTGGAAGTENFVRISD